MQTQEAVGLLCGYGVYVLVCASFNTVLAAMARRSGGAEGSLLADQSVVAFEADGGLVRTTTLSPACPAFHRSTHLSECLGQVADARRCWPQPSEHEVSEMGSVRPGRTHSAAPTLNGSFASNCELEESIDMDDP